MDLPKRKHNRLQGFDYSTPGAYFITVCVKDRKNLLSRIVGGGALDAPQNRLTEAGEIVNRYILGGNQIPGVNVEKYVIMPNHVHMILLVDKGAAGGTSWSPSPTNGVVPHFISTWKRFCHKALGRKIFQRSYHDHVIRSEADYLKIWEYIDTNPIKWKEDCFYNEEEARYE